LQKAWRCRCSQARRQRQMIRNLSRTHWVTITRIPHDTSRNNTIPPPQTLKPHPWSTLPTNLSHHLPNNPNSILTRTDVRFDPLYPVHWPHKLLNDKKAYYGHLSLQ
jgi:hypothetical protein